jgi:UDPglucose 6-dehydrogenase
MKISVIGMGCVGLVTAGCFAESGNDVICVDNDREKIAGFKKNVVPIYERLLDEIVKRNRAAGRLHFTTELAEGVGKASVIFIAVETPSAEDGSADISAVLDVSGKIAELMDGYRVIVTKSTVPMGTYKKVSEMMASRTKYPFDYVSNPEFIRTGSAVVDFMAPDYVVIGGDNSKAMKIVEQLYRPFVREKNRIIFMDPASAELTKYAVNSMLAVRLSFMNEMSALCEKVGADIEHVRAVMSSDVRIGSTFLSAGIGYGGSCLVKDVQALTHIGDSLGCSMTIVKSVHNANLCQQNRLTQRILDYFADKAKITLAVWGLAFKPQTSDIREAPAIFCIKKFLEAGIKVRAYDPQAMYAAKKLLGNRIETSQKSYEILKGADGLVIFTDWQEFRNPDFELIAQNLNKAVIFDGRNLYEPSYVRAKGIEYHCIGRPTTKY